MYWRTEVTSLVVGGATPRVVGGGGGTEEPVPGGLGAVVDAEELTPVKKRS